jgi:hypothetical protein
MDEEAISAWSTYIDGMKRYIDPMLQVKICG